ncbi:hypothetical protein FNH05_21085 [Amycolatopsis rhizosphaerae]|uniref:DUF485 domain-containing protein n=1 Tax=Amycolatopsis rhizosphaerae TaxID=2053003 RepID=A0A558C7I8_9PSEU|nr:hypothetical protein [Amycolatopsis rhizosphaerae]TVT44754.1 hypothetical protein FNH05_21085 [Amycolatopsis rhizosphaerae]
MSRPRRVAVTSPQTRLAHLHRRSGRPWRARRLDAAETSRALELYRRQRVLAAVTLTALTALLLGLPVAFTLWPGLDRMRLLGLPVSWVLLGVAPFPAMVSLGWWQSRRAERIEDRR